MKPTGLGAGIASTLGHTSYVYLWFITLSIDGLLRRRTNVRNSCNPLNYSLGSGFGLLVHTGRFHSHSVGHRDHCDPTARHSRPTSLSLCNALSAGAIRQATLEMPSQFRNDGFQGCL